MPRRSKPARRIVEQTSKLRETGQLIAQRCRQNGDEEIATLVEDALIRIGNQAMILVAAAETLRNE